MNDKIEDKPEVIKVLVLSEKQESRKKTLSCLQQVDDNHSPIGEVMVFSRIPLSVIGEICTVEIIKRKNTISIFPSTLLYTEQYKNREHSIELKAEQRSLETKMTAFKQSDRIRNSHSDILELLEPLRRAWDKTNAVGKLALEVRVLNYLRNGRDL